MEETLEKTTCLENKLLLISINFTPKTSHSCPKKRYTMFSRWKGSSFSTFPGFFSSPLSPIGPLQHPGAFLRAFGHCSELLASGGGGVGYAIGSVGLVYLASNLVLKNEPKSNVGYIYHHVVDFNGTCK